MDTPQPNGEVPKELKELDESQKTWQEFLQKCCEVGQLVNALDQLDGQKREIEKNLEVTQRAVKSAANKHKELQQQRLAQQAKAIAEPTDPASH